MNIKSNKNHPTRTFCGYCGQVELFKGDDYYTHELSVDTFCSYSCAKHDLDTTHGDKVPCNHCGYPIEDTPDADLCDACEDKYWDWQRRRAYNM